MVRIQQYSFISCMVGLKQATLGQYDLKLVWDQSRVEPPWLFGRKPLVGALNLCLSAEVI